MTAKRKCSDKEQRRRTIQSLRTRAARGKKLSDKEKHKLLLLTMPGLDTLDWENKDIELSKDGKSISIKKLPDGKTQISAKTKE
jgi:hypothetical protein